MWISKKKAVDKYTEAVALGYKRGYLAGQIEMLNRFWPLICAIERDTEILRKLHDVLVQEPASFVDRQIEAILQRAEENDQI